MRRLRFESAGCFLRALWARGDEDNITIGAASLGYYLMLSIFPALIVLLTLLPFLPIHHLDQQAMRLLQQALPRQSADLLTGIVRQILLHQHGGLLSVGLLGTLWAASNGTYAIMEQLNIIGRAAPDNAHNGIVERRPYWKARGISILLTFAVGALTVTAFALIVLGGVLQAWVGRHLLGGGLVGALFAVGRWAIIAGLLTVSLELTYHFGPDRRREFRPVSAGSLTGMSLLVASSLGFRFYVAHFDSYDATYGGLGAAMALMLWLYILGLVILVGFEINALAADRNTQSAQAVSPPLAFRALPAPGGAPDRPSRSARPPRETAPDGQARRASG